MDQPITFTLSDDEREYTWHCTRCGQSGQHRSAIGYIDERADIISDELDAIAEHHWLGLCLTKAAESHQGGTP